MANEEDFLEIGGHKFHSRFILGSGKYSLKLIEAAVQDAVERAVGIDIL